MRIKKNGYASSKQLFVSLCGKKIVKKSTFEREFFGNDTVSIYARRRIKNVFRCKFLIN